ncbi:hypothetical protein G9A89_021311 [Geosiphon pyriformis]|nr:hypothetical protein G9A89_021311 [Geosiphon pyriformis]
MEEPSNHLNEPKISRKSDLFSSFQSQESFIASSTSSLPNLVDFSTFEDEKENILPLKQGRSAVALSQVFSANPSIRHAQLQGGHAQFAEELKHLNELDDPLDVFDRYIKWTIENYPQGHNHDSNLIPLFEHTVRTFQDDIRYKNDARYLKYWLQYAKYVDEPRDVFVFLDRKDIGMNFAAYYEEYATLLEASKKLKEADEIFRLGIHRRAQPLQRLNKRYRQFQTRMVITPNPSNDKTTLHDVKKTSRTILGAKTSSSSSSTGLENKSQRERLVKKEFIDMSSNQGRLSVLYDPDGKLGMESLANSSTVIPWLDLGTEASRKKENIPEPTQWKGEKFPQNSSLRIPMTEKLAVYHDEQPIQVVTTTLVNEPILRNENAPQENSNQTKTISKDSEKFVKAAPKSQPTSKQEQVRKSLTSERLFVDIEKFIIRGEEMSLEEMKARHFGWIDSEGQYKDLEDKTPDNSRVEEIDFNRVQQSPEYPETKTEGFKSYSSEEDIRHIQIRKEKTSDQPSPTVDTKEVLADVCEMFNQPLKCGESDDRRHGILPSIAENSKTQSESFHRKQKKIDENLTQKKFNIESTHTGQKRKGMDENYASEDDENSFLDPDHHKGTAKRQALGLHFNKDNDSCGRSPAPSEHKDLIVELKSENLKRNQYSNQRGEVRIVPFKIMTPIDERNSEYESSISSSEIFGKSELSLSSSGKRADFPCHIFGSTYALPHQVSKNCSVADSGLNPIFGETDERLVSQIPRMFDPQLPEINESETTLLSSITPGLGSLAEKLCNPMDFHLRGHILGSLNPSLQTYAGFYDDHKSEKNGLEGISRYVRNCVAPSRRRTFNGSEPNYAIQLFEDLYIIKRKIGEGGFGKVYCALHKNKSVLEIDDWHEPYHNLTSSESNSLCALKIQSPPDAWEFYVIHQLRGRISAPIIDSFISVNSLYYYKDESYMVGEYLQNGTILDVINAVTNERTNMDELLVAFFTIELLKVIESMHTAGIIHGDMKPDNCLLRLDPVDEWDPQYCPSGGRGWSKKGIKIIDFGRGIDLTLFPEEIKFVCDWETTGKDCYEMRVGKPWKWETDYYGLAGIIYCMLHHQYLETSPIEEMASNTQNTIISTKKRFKPLLPFKRYWQEDLWRRVFDMLINPSYVRPDGKLPITNELKAIRGDLEEFLRVNCERNGKSLKSMLRKLEKN